MTSVTFCSDGCKGYDPPKAISIVMSAEVDAHSLWLVRKDLDTAKQARLAVIFTLLAYLVHCCWSKTGDDVATSGCTRKRTLVYWTLTLRLRHAFLWTVAF